jgi:hypothetical protein
MTSASEMGWAINHSRVPPRRSSASVRIVAAGTKTANKIGSKSKRGLIEAKFDAYILRKPRKREIPRNATTKT